MNQEPLVFILQKQLIFFSTSGGQFAMAAGGHIDLASGGQFKPVAGGQFEWIFHYGTGMTGIRQVFKKLQISNQQNLSDELSAEIIARIKYPEPSRNKLKRLTQINGRKNHLLRLYYKHKSNTLKTTYG